MDRACTVLAGLIAALNVVAYALAAADKRRARSGRARVRERTFWTMAALGAWPGIALAMARHRHKTRKPGFLVPFWLAAAVGTGVLVGLVAWCAGLLPVP